MRRRLVGGDDPLRGVALVERATISEISLVSMHSLPPAHSRVWLDRARAVARLADVRTGFADARRTHSDEFDD